MKDDESFARLHALFEKMFCSPATSAPTEHVFSHSGLCMPPHRARMGGKMLSNLVFLKCNTQVFRFSIYFFVTTGKLKFNKL
jgi:hAT family C-terminal dimerisation region